MSLTKKDTYSNKFIIPSIDLLDNQVVRLYQGSYSKKTTYNINIDTLIDRYKYFENLHIVDLNAAKNGQLDNYELIKNIRNKFDGKIQFGGGVRSMYIAEKLLLDIGINRVVLGTIAVTDINLTKQIIQRFGSEKVVLALDCESINNEFLLKINGWQETYTRSLFDVLSEYKDCAKYLLVTDIAIDGTMSGSNIELYKQIKRQFPDFLIQASGGVASLRDIEQLQHITNFAIIGKSLYDGLYEALAISTELSKYASVEKAKNLKRFFKATENDSDIFIGVTIPQIRKIVNQYHAESSFVTVTSLLASKVHEYKLAGILLLVRKAETEKDRTKRSEIVNFYLSDNILNTLNNWDLIDISCYKILKDISLDEIDILHKLAQSNSHWHRRVAIVSTFALIKRNILEPTIAISKILLNDKHYLIHKATGWMLREVGKRDKKLLMNFLNDYAKTMPRVMLSYAIEKLDSNEKLYIRSISV